MNRLLIEKPDVAKELGNLESWGRNASDHLILYALNLLEMVNDMRLEGIIGELDWEPWRKFLENTASSLRFQEFWSSLRGTGVYDRNFAEIVDGAVADAKSLATGKA